MEWPQEDNRCEAVEVSFPGDEPGAVRARPMKRIDVVEHRFYLATTGL